DVFRADGSCVYPSLDSSVSIDAHFAVDHLSLPGKEGASRYRIYELLLVHSLTSKNCAELVISQQLLANSRRVNDQRLDPLLFQLHNLLFGLATGFLICSLPKGEQRHRNCKGRND